MKTIGLILISTIMIFNQANSQDVGDVAPDFTLKNLSDQNFTLSNQKGNIVFIFFIGYACPYCLASSPDVKSKIVNVFSGNPKFEVVLIDTWDGSKTAVQSFKNSTGINAIYLQQGGKVSSNWNITYDRLSVVDEKGKIIFKGNQSAGSDADEVMDIIQNALSNLVVNSVNDLNIPEKNSLRQNYPNPVIDNTKIEFSITEPANATISISDISGKVILVPVTRFFSPGNHLVEINLTGIPKGIYLYKLQAGNFTAFRKMIVR